VSNKEKGFVALTPGFETCQLTKNFFPLFFFFFSLRQEKLNIIKKKSILNFSPGANPLKLFYHHNVRKSVNYGCKKFL
jgi:hypothetical protein